MPQARYAIVLQPAQVAFLTRVSQSRRRPHRQRRAAQILLLRAERTPVRAVARQLGCSTRTVVATCRRFCEGGWSAAIRELPRGRPRQYSSTARQRVIAWATADPQALGLPITRWSLAWLQRCWRRRLRSAPPARSTLRRWLRAARVRWSAVRSWCRSNDPHYDAKVRAICDAYRSADPSTAVLCYDQKPHLQALSRRHPNRSPQPGRAGQRDHDYRRHGTVCLHSLLDVRSGRCRAASRPDHRSATIAKLLGRWLSARPEPRLVLILDNLSANHAPAVKAAIAACGKQVTVLRTPTYSSWLNLIEAVFSHLQRELLDNLQTTSTAQLARKLRGWFQSWNARAKPFNWTFHPDSALCGTAH